MIPLCCDECATGRPPASPACRPGPLARQRDQGSCHKPSDRRTGISPR